MGWSRLEEFIERYSGGTRTRSLFNSIDLSIRLGTLRKAPLTDQIFELDDALRHNFLRITFCVNSCLGTSILRTLSIEFAKPTSRLRSRLPTQSSLRIPQRETGAIQSLRRGSEKKPGMIPGPCLDNSRGRVRATSCRTPLQHNWMPSVMSHTDSTMRNARCG